jgi:dTDP-3-amino-3,4,6-trideoxy-alpha-D-glucose transaminase
VTPITVPFLDLRPGEDAADVRAAVDRVIDSGWFVLGPEVEAFEAEFAAASGARYAVGVGSGTDAIALLLRAAGIGAGDEVIVPAFTAAFTALAVTAVGARPVFADVDGERLTMDPDSCAGAITPRTRAIVPVHLYGQAADTTALRAIAERQQLALIEDCCQAHLATSRRVPVGTEGIGGAFSFYPTKNLAALGDGGAVVTNDEALAARVRRLRNGGQAERYAHVDVGVNSRLDELQAAVLRARLPRLASYTARRREIAAAYRTELPSWLRAVPQVDEGHVYHVFAVRTADRGPLQRHLRDAGIQTLIHYPAPLTEQPAFADAPRTPCPAAARAAREVLSLPLHPGLSDEDVRRVIDAAGTFQKGGVLA